MGYEVHDLPKSPLRRAEVSFEGKPASASHERQAAGWGGNNCRKENPAIVARVRASNPPRLIHMPPDTARGV